ncbi:hypothetical protein ACE6H2_026026 [Prunus campanulata]
MRLSTEETAGVKQKKKKKKKKKKIGCLLRNNSRKSEWIAACGRKIIKEMKKGIRKEE